jgi:hypothetical protein
MKKIALLLISLTIFTTACNKPTIQEKAQVNLPDWVINPNIEGKISAVGIAPKSKGGLQIQIPQAEADARANIAAILQTEVSRLTKDAIRSAKVSNVEEFDNVFSQATKNLVKKIPLTGSKRVNMFRDNSDGSLYIQMALDSKLVTNYLAENKAVFKKDLMQASANQEYINNAEKAVEKLYNDLDKELND